MSAAAEALLAELYQLSEKDRAYLAHYLLQSLGSDEVALDEAAFEAELKRRHEDMLAAPAARVPAAVALATLRSKYTAS